MNILLLSLLFLQSIKLSSGLIRLSEVTDKGTLVLAVEIGANLFLSSSDDAPLLQNIQIINKDTTKSALDLKNLGINKDGSRIGWEAIGLIILNSTNTISDAQNMTGFLYFTTLTQAQDPNFLVYSVDQRRNISSDRDDLTLVFLNQDLKMQNSQLYVPEMSSRVSGLETSATSSVSIYWNTPTENYKDPDSDDSSQQRIFSNPLQIGTVNYYFGNVEPMNIFNRVWYIRSSGKMKVQVEPKFEDPNGSATTNATTTGLVMCSYAPENLKINMISSSSSTAASTGLVVLYNVINPVVFKMDGFDFVITNKSELRNERDGTNEPVSSSFIEISSDVSIAGRFAVQYFKIEGFTFPTLSTTPETVATTKIATKSFEFLSFSVTILILALNKLKAVPNCRCFAEKFKILR